jgi:hypothetical protein
MERRKFYAKLVVFRFQNLQNYCGVTVGKADSLLTSNYNYNNIILYYSNRR